MDFGISDLSDQPVRIEPLGFGSVVTVNTMEKMKQIIISSIHEYYVRLWAEKIVDFADDDYSKVESIYNFIVNHCRYLHDPVGLELLKTPKLSLQLIESGGSPAIDCDDATMLIGALIMSVGFLTLSGQYPLMKSILTFMGWHILKDQGIGNGWLPIDFVMAKKGGELGQEPPGITKIKDMEI